MTNVVPSSAVDSARYASVGFNPATLNRLIGGGGESAFDRNLYASGGSQLSNGVLFLTPLTALRSEVCGNIVSYSGGTAAVGATFAKMGLYLYDSAGNATLLAGTANDATLWSGTFTQYKRALSTPVNKTAGLTYGLGMLIVGTTTAPAVTAPVNNGGAGMWQAEFQNSPGPGRALGPFADLPASVAALSLAVGNAFIVELVP